MVGNNFELRSVKIFFYNVPPIQLLVIPIRLLSI